MSCSKDCQQRAAESDGDALIFVGFLYAASLVALIALAWAAAWVAINII